jgi:antitoxin ParD1/3/4
MVPMSKNTSVSLGDHFTAFIETQVAQGPLRLGERRHARGVAPSRSGGAKLAALRAALVEGERSGTSAPFDFDAFIARKRRAPTASR